MRKIIRIFISSTFLHFDKERNILVGKVFPKLRERCREKGFSFRAVDLRWGITENQGKKHQTADICFEEIQRCIEYSPKPNFIVLSDDYYGWVPSPSLISQDCWGRIREELSHTNPDGLKYLEKWYRKDLNDLAGSMILQEVSAEEGGTAFTQDVENRINDILFPAAQKVIPEKDPLQVAFGGSLTEQEINLGLFSQKGASEHTLVMIRDNNSESNGGSSTDSPFNAHKLNEHLKSDMSEGGSQHWIPLRQETLEKDALDFLTKVIDEQMEQVLREEKQKTPFDLEYSDLRDALSLSAEDYIDVGDRLRDLDQYARKNRGRTVLLKGRQGSGKSTLLRHFVNLDQKTRFGVFPELQSGRNTLETALTFLADLLSSRGLLTNTVVRESGEHIVTWFERQMSFLDKKAEITLVLDCAEMISDFRNQEESLFSIHLPKGVVFLVSCIDENSLSDIDVQFHPPAMVLKDVYGIEREKIILQMLREKGRTLTSFQQNSLKELLPESVTPLYLRQIASELGAVRAYREEDALPQIFTRPAKDTFSLVRKMLEQKGKEYLPALYSHVLTYIAISSRGVSEEELIELLMREMESGSELNAELLKNSKWEIMDREHVINIFWSRMKYNLQNYFGVYPDHEKLLIRFHHGVIREAALSIVNPRYGDEGEKKYSVHNPVVQNYRDYWMEQSIYTFAKPGNVIVNRRRADELIPLLLHVDEKEQVRNQLENMQNLDAMIRLERYRQLLDLLERAEKNGYGSAKTHEFLELLKSNEILLTCFFDSFIPLCARHGMNVKEAAAAACIPGWLDPGKVRPAMDPAEGHRRVLQSCSGDRKIMIPGCVNSPMALRGDGVMAVLDRGSIRIYDWNRRRYSSASFPMEKKSDDFLHWKGDLLILRRIRQRLVFRFIKGYPQTDDQIVLEKEESCSNLSNLMDDKEEVRRAAGSIEEEDAVCRRSELLIEYYLKEGVLKERQIGCPGGQELTYYRHYSQAAIVRDREFIDLVFLDAWQYRETLRVINVNGVFYSDDGKWILIRTGSDTVYLHKISDEGRRPMTEYQITPKSFEKEAGRQKLKEIFDLAPFFEPRKKRDIPYNVKSDSLKGLPYPILTCMSAAYSWYAAYYYYNGLAAVRVFNLKTGGEILSSEVEPIYSKDIFSCPFRSEEGGRKLVIQSSGRMRSLDLVEGEPVWRYFESGRSNAAKTGKRKKEDIEDISEEAVSQKMKEDCKKHMWKWFPRYRYESVGERIDGLFDSFAGRIAFRLFWLFLTPFAHVLMVNQINNQEFIYTPQIIHTQDYVWLIDAVYRTIHVADKQGNWLCHSQIQEPFAAADAIGDTLFLLSEGFDSVRSFRFTDLTV